MWKIKAEKIELYRKWSKALPPLTIFSGAGVFLLTIAMIWSYNFNLKEFPPDVANPSEMTLLLPEVPSLIIMPFVSETGYPIDRLRAEWFTKNLIEKLGQISELFLISEETSTKFQNTPFSIKKVSEAVGVRYLVTGSVARANNKTSIFIRIVDAFNGTIKWAHTYKRPFTEFFDVPKLASNKILETLNISMEPAKLDEIFAKGPENYDAWINYSHAIGARLSGELNTIENSMDFLKTAQTYDAFWAAIPAEIALNYCHLVEQSLKRLDDGDFETLIALGMGYAEEAIKLDRTASAGWEAKRKLLILSGDKNQAIEIGQMAVKLRPNSFALKWDLAMALNRMSFYADALPYLKNALRMHPGHSAKMLQTLAETELAVGELESALVTIEKVLKRRPDELRARLIKIFINGSLDRWEEAEEDVQFFLRLYPEFKFSEWLPSQSLGGPLDPNDWFIVLGRAGLADRTN